MSQKRVVLRGIRFFIAGRLTGGLLGAVWLMLLVNILPVAQSGIYFGCLAIFELAQLASSLGIYSYCQRFLPSAWASASRSGLRATLLFLAMWRITTLALAASAVFLGWNSITQLLDWPAVAPSNAMFAGYLLANGMARFVEALFESMLQQGKVQVLNALRNTARLAALLLVSSHGGPVTAGWALSVDIAVASAFVAIGAAWLLQTAGVSVNLPLASPASADQRLRISFSVQGYASLIVSLACGIDVIKLVVSHTAGPAALAVFGLAVALTDMVGRYMPASLLYGYIRTVLTAMSENGSERGRTMFGVRLLMRVNGTYLSLVGAVLMLAFAASLALPARPDRVNLSSVVPIVAALFLPLYLQSLRLMASLVAHVRTDNRTVLVANLATLPAPVLVIVLTPLAGLLGAITGVWFLELVNAAVMIRRSRLRLNELCGTSGLWWAMGIAAVAAATAGLVVQRALSGFLGLAVAIPTVAALYLAFMWRGRRWEAEEVDWLHALFNVGQRTPAG